MDDRHCIAEHADELIDRRVQLLEKASVRPLPKTIINDVAAILRERIDQALEIRRGLPDRIPQIGNCLRLPRPQRLVGMGGIDQLRVLSSHRLHFLEALGDDLDLRDDILDLADALVQMVQIGSALLDGTLGPLNIGTC